MNRLISCWNILRAKIRQNRHYQIGMAVFGLLILLWGTEIGLNLQVRHALQASLIKQAGPDTRATVHLQWLSLMDMVKGKIGKLSLEGVECRVGRIKLKQLRIDSAGLVLDPKVLLTEKRLLLHSILRTEIQAVVSDTAATEYFNQDYGHLKPVIRFEPGRLKVTGETEFLGQTVPLQLDGLLQVQAPRTLRFYPEQLQISHRSVSRSLLKLVGDQIPLAVEVLQEWPVQIKELRLEKGLLVLKLREYGG